jgi:uncharacterized membrane protein
MNLGLLGTLGLGACLMYILDPQQGKRRRAVARDKMTRFTHKSLDAIDVTSRDLKNRAFGLVAETRRLISREEVSDDVLAERVRSALGPIVGHPSSIDVRAENGKITLSGPILADEVDRLLKQVSSMRGVRTVENRLQVHQSAESVPGLQGQPALRKAGQVPDIAQSNWSPTTRFMAGTAGGALALYGAKQLNLLGAAIGAVGTAILTRALTNIEFKRLTGIGAGRRAIDIHKIINVAAPVEDVFAFWANYQNFPRFMSNVRQVQETGDNRSHWVVAGPAGVPIEWNAIVTNYVPNQSLGWKTAPGSPIAHAGIVRFEPNPDGSTRVEVRMTYNPVAGALGHTVASLFGADPKSEMDADLMRMKSMIETGVPPHDASRKDGGEAYTH